MSAGSRRMPDGDTLNAGQVLNGNAGLALTVGDRTLLRFLTTSDREVARLAWSAWKSQHPLDEASASEQRILPAVSQQLRALAIEEPDIGRFRGITRFLWLWSQRATRASLDAARTLRERDITVVALKGLALHALGIQSPAERPITDGDLLVAGDVRRACLLLQSYGWRVLRHQRHAWTCVRGPQEELDVHQFPLHIDARSRTFTLAEATRLEGSYFGLPTPAHLLVHACLHGVRRGGSVLWALDVLRIIERKGVAWSAVLNLARDRGYALMLADALRAVSERVPEWVLQGLENLPVSPLEALEYASASGCNVGPWTPFAQRAGIVMREVRASSERLDEHVIGAAHRRAGVTWHASWPAQWQRLEPAPRATSAQQARR